MASKSYEKSLVTTEEDGSVKLFGDIMQGPSSSELCFRLIHSWEARNNSNTRNFLGLEHLRIDEKDTVLQEFINPGRASQFSANLIPRSVYSLKGFFGIKSKDFYRVDDESLTIQFSHASVIRCLDDYGLSIVGDKFRVRNYDEFEAICDHKHDIYDVVVHIEVINGEPVNGHPVLYEAELEKTRHILIHIQVKEGACSEIVSLGQ